ncbi:MAG: anaerobic glycerol-3-phosphate dehydrogenase subunit GlpA, partial [Anaerolineales bacterium]
MRRIQTDILVIGGGATGTGVLRDLAMRGFKCVLVERRDLAYGTTGRFHGLLHSGSRYVVKDPDTARDCIDENKILRHIMPQCIEDTGGYFVLTPVDDLNYVSQFLDGCKKALIPIENIPIHHMLKQEPMLNPNILQCFHVPDASADSFLATELNAESARQYDAQVLEYHEVLSLQVDHKTIYDHPSVVGAHCHDLVKDEEVMIESGIVINASGAWSGKISQTAGVNITMVPGKGTMLALNHRVVNTIINRCKLPSDGDILVPAHTVAVIGTTDVQVTNPDHYSIEPKEIRLLLDEGEKLIPAFKQFRVLRAWASVRPLVQDAGASKYRDLSRGFVLLDHAKRDGIDGLITITGGKWTTYRKMAEVCVDKVCEKLNVDLPCRTHLEPLPDKPKGKAPHHYLGARLENIEAAQSYGQLICECELVTEEELEKSIIQSDTVTLDDIRRETRLGMGPCQGAFCTFRAAGVLHALRHSPITETNVLLRDFLQERWKGNLPILWGQQLRQARFNEFVYIDILNATGLPGDRSSKVVTDEYDKPEETEYKPSLSISQTRDPFVNKQAKPIEDIVVIGSGFAGLIAAWRASEEGHHTKVVTKGWGTPYWGSGCIDIFGYKPSDYQTFIDSPGSYLEDFIKDNPTHPYSRTGLTTLEKAIKSFLELCDESQYPFIGSLDANIWLPTALGTLRPTCLVPISMAAGDTKQKSPMLIVGFNGYLDFSSTLVVDNLRAQGVLAQDIIININSLRQRKFIYGITIARLFDNPEFRQEVIDAVKPRLNSVSRIGFPAVLGLDHSKEAREHLESELGLPVFEIPGLPPSIPGIRLQNLLVSAIERNHGVILNGMEVSNFSFEGKTIKAIWSEAASRKTAHQAKTYILSTGGILGGGVCVNHNGYAQEAIFGLPVNIPEHSSQWFQKEFLSDKSHPIFTTNVPINNSFQPIDMQGEVIYQNLYTVGGVSANCDPIRERSLEGIA